MKHKDYAIEAIKEKHYAVVDGDHGEKLLTTYTVSVGDKVIAVGLSSVESAKEVIDRRIKLRSRVPGLEPAG